MATDAISSATLAILAGGEGSRMGMPKGMLRIGTEPILTYLLDRLQWNGPTALITAPGREHPPGCERFDHEWTDPVSGEGPLRGVLTALENAKTPIVLVTTVDMPGVGREQLSWLSSRFASDDMGVMCRSGEQIEPFPMACRADAAAVVRSRIDAGRLSVHQLAHDARFQLLNAPTDWDESVWTNLNRPEELDRFLRRTQCEDG